MFLVTGLSSRRSGLNILHDSRFPLMLTSLIRSREKLIGRPETFRKMSALDVLLVCCEFMRIRIDIHPFFFHLFVAYFLLVSGSGFFPVEVLCEIGCRLGRQPPIEVDTCWEGRRRVGGHSTN